MALRSTVLDSYLKNIKRNLRRLLLNSESHNRIKNCQLDPFLTQLRELIKEFESFEKQIFKQNLTNIDIQTDVVGIIRHFVKQYHRLIADINIVYRDRCCMTEIPKREDYLP